MRASWVSRLVEVCTTLCISIDVNFLVDIDVDIPIADQICSRSANSLALFRHSTKSHLKLTSVAHRDCQPYRGNPIVYSLAQRNRKLEVT